MSGAPSGDRPEGAGPAALSKGRIALAFAVAVASDAVSVPAEWVLPAELALDGATALALFLVLGRRWTMLLPLVAEAIPGVAAFPTWVAYVAAVAFIGPVVGKGLKKR